ncbi:MAG: alginate export family protein [Chromatiales bacterium]|nr:alginate export family protein [Chromatiales bacterium]
MIGRAPWALLLVLACAPALAGSSIGGHFELDLESERNFDLDRSRADTRTLIAPEFQLEWTWNLPANGLHGYVQAELKRKFELEEQGRDRDYEWSLDLEEAWVEIPFGDSGWSLRLGRQDFEDEREWLYDDSLDGARLFYRGDTLQAEFAAVRQTGFRREFLDEHEDGEFDFWQAMASYLPRKEWTVTAYAMGQQGRNGSEADPWWLGLRSRGRLNEHVQHWLELALMRGDDASTSLDAHALDLGVTWLIGGRWNPSLTVGFALGSGDGDPNDGTDHAFRQIGIQDNDDRLNGVTPFLYYGEALDPELSNLRIFTLGAGFRPTKKSSVDLVWHDYRQARRSDAMRDIAFDDPNGVDRDLGYEFDLILGYREIKNLKLELMLGYFVPGDAFGPDADPALFVGSEARFKF